MGKNGDIIGKPWQLVRAELVDGLCQRWGCRPSELMREDADGVLQMLACLAEARGQPVPHKDGGEPGELSEAELGFNMRTLGG